MIKKIDIAGLQLDNYTVREMIMRVDRRISEKIPVSYTHLDVYKRQ